MSRATRASCSPSARLTSQKGIDVAIRALPLLPDDTVLVVLGEGPERGALERLAQDVGVEGRVFLRGRVPDVAAWLRRATVLVHPARWEGFGLGVLEAMLAGLPVVASSVSSLPELVVDGETGVLVVPDDRIRARSRGRAGTRAAGPRRGRPRARAPRVLRYAHGGAHGEAVPVASQLTLTVARSRAPS